MTLVELQYLVALATTRHFGRAALASHVSQPTLSAAIKHLEDELGETLVERAPSGARLTPTGERVVAQARQVLDAAARVSLAVRERPEPLTGRLRLGAIATLAPFAIGPLLVPLQRAHPRLDLVLREGLTEDLLARLRLGELDAVLLALPAGEPGLDDEAIFDEPFVALVSARSPLAKRRSVRPGELSAGPLILLTEGHCFRNQALDVCRGHLALEEPARDPLAATSLYTVWHMVEADMGATLIPQLAADEILRAKSDARVKPLVAPVPSRRIGIAWRTALAATDDAHAVAAFLRTHLPDTLAPVPAPAR